MAPYPERIQSCGKCSGRLLLYGEFDVNLIRNARHRRVYIHFLEKAQPLQPNFDASMYELDAQPLPFDAFTPQPRPVSTCCQRADSPDIARLPRDKIFDDFYRRSG